MDTSFSLSLSLSLSLHSTHQLYRTTQVLYRGDGSVGDYYNAGVFDAARAVVGPIADFTNIPLWRFRVIGGDKASDSYDQVPARRPLLITVDLHQS